ncbi:MAG TPA: hypothetical protein VIK72_10400 [Clostridiaceae bacterium]
MKRLILFLLVFVLLSGCQQKPLICSPEIQKARNTAITANNFILTVVSDDTNMKEGKLKIFIDAKLFMMEGFISKNYSNLVNPNNFYNYSLKLSKGKHKIKIQCADGTDETGDFQIGDSCHYGMISYSKTNNITYLKFQDSAHRYLFD